jgi:hypothetical protein
MIGRVKDEDIFKPGAKHEARALDFDDPAIRKIFDAYKARQHQILDLENRPFKNVTIMI